MQQVCARRKLFCAVAALMGCTTVRLCTELLLPYAGDPGSRSMGRCPLYRAIRSVTLPPGWCSNKGLFGHGWSPLYERGAGGISSGCDAGKSPSPPFAKGGKQGGNAIPQNVSWSYTSKSNASASKTEPALAPQGVPSCSDSGREDAWRQIVGAVDRLSVGLFHASLRPTPHTWPELALVHEPGSLAP